MTDRVHTIVADPPWAFSDALPGNGRGASKHYATMPVEKIERFLIDHHAELPRIPGTALLFMWRVGAMQEEALRVIRAWGFELKSEIVWEKTIPGSDDRDLVFGMGHYTRWCHETCLIASRGQGSTLIQNRSIRSTFRAPIGQHSEKPDKFYDIVRKLAKGPYLELFARKTRAGWIQHGLELGKLGGAA